MRAEGLMGEPAPYLLLLLLLGYCLAVIDGELRCYCNESGCVSTGYMCKSAAGQCYTAVEVQGDKTQATHGCLDSVPLQNRGLCGRDAASGEGAGTGGGGSTNAGGRRDREQERERERTEVIRGGGGTDTGVAGVLICCAEDMCNYYGENEIKLFPRNITGGKGGVGDRGGVIYSRNDERHDDDRDLWFKAAVIAVPIAGGFILVLLVLLAVRMLRTDTQRHRRLIQIRRERSLTKAQLYVTDHFSDGSTKSDVSKTCSLFPPKTHEAGVGGGGGMGVGVGVGSLGVKVGLGGGKPVCRDVNISVDREGRVYEKVCDVSVHRHSQLPSVVKWGNPTKADLATVV